MLRFLTLFLLLASCSDTGSGAGSLGPLQAFEFAPAESGEWGEMMAKSYADSLEEVRIQDSTENAEFTRWADSMKTTSKQNSNQ